MFGPRISTVFASRWKALLWSLGILLTAYCSVPSPDDESSGVEGIAKSVIARHEGAGNDSDQVNPWAKEKH